MSFYFIDTECHGQDCYVGGPVVFCPADFKDVGFQDVVTRGLHTKCVANPENNFTSKSKPSRLNPGQSSKDCPRIHSGDDDQGLGVFRPLVPEVLRATSVNIKLIRSSTRAIRWSRT